MDCSVRAYGDWRVYAKSLVGCATEFHNDVCSGCKEEKDEDVICCDTCNLVFHLECVDPPLLQSKYAWIVLPAI